MTLYTGGFSRFVTSTTAPIATGWSDLAGRDSHPLRNRAFARRTKNSTLTVLGRRSPLEYAAIKLYSAIFPGNFRCADPVLCKAKLS